MSSMGEAKNRGTKEERVKKAQERQKAERDALAIVRAARCGKSSAALNMIAALMNNEVT